MGNRERGIIDINVDDQTYKLRFDANAMCELESRAGISISEFLTNLDKAGREGTLRMTDVRLLFWTGLISYQPELSETDAGNIISDLGGLYPAMDVLMEAVSLAFPKAEAPKTAKPGKPKAVA